MLAAVLRLGRITLPILATLALALSVGACEGEAGKDDGKAKSADDGGKAKSADDGGKIDAADGAATQGEAMADGQMLSNEVAELPAILVKSPEAVEAILGEPKESAERESSCVRFVPERVFFKCKHDTRLYDHPKLTHVKVDYQDGAAAIVEFVGLQGDGPFSQDAALAFVGLALPGKPKHTNPTSMAGNTEDVVDVWDYGNSSARLRVDGHQFRVRVSSVNSTWEGTKIELIDNTPLTEDQQSRIMAVKGEGAETTPEGTAAPKPAIPGPTGLDPETPSE